MRAHHTQLNRLITTRLPLCLPPHASSPYQYLAGMTLFSHLYTTIEEVWQELLDGQCRCERMLDVLQTLETPGLRRTETIRADLHEIEHRLGNKVPHDLHTLHKQSAQYSIELKQLFLQRPVLLLAWTWNMYLAIFNGGRFIREQLRSAGTEFWMGEHCLSFWEFDGDQDGEDIKKAFKKHFEVASQSLTRGERQELIRESVRVFEVCEAMIKVLDDSLGTEPKQIQQVETVQQAAGFLTMLSGSWQAMARMWLFFRKAARPVAVQPKAVSVEATG